jgi:putative MATE family efflux protein
MDQPASSKGASSLVEGPIARTLVIFALPVLGSNVLQSLNGSVNAIWVGRLLGEAALAATSNANLILFLVLGTVFGVGMAATILVAQGVGANDLTTAKRVVGTGATSFAAASFILALAGYLFAEQILGLLATPVDALPLAASYLRVIFVAVPVMTMLSFVMTVLRGAGDSRTPFYFMALSVGLDVALNPLLILGVGPLPALGIAGAGLSTLLAQAVSLAAFIGSIYARRHPLRLERGELRYLVPNGAILASIVGKGVPMGLQMIVISASAMLLMGLVNQHGSQVAAAYGVAAQLWTYIQMPALAIGAAVSSMVAQNVGARRLDRIGRITAVGVLSNLAMTGALVLVVLFADGALIALFLPEDSRAVAIAAHINAEVAWTFVMFGVTIVLFGTVRATGAVTPPLLILVFSILLVRTGFAYLLQPLAGQDAIWWSFAVGSVVSLALAAAYYRFGAWRTARPIMERPPCGEPPETGLGLPRERARLGEREEALADP